MKDNIVGKKCPLCKERGRADRGIGKLEKAENKKRTYFYQCKSDPRHLFLSDGTNLIVQYSDKEEDKKRAFSIRDLIAPIEEKKWK
jgi:hypothetical protein